jgi:hypothetical protein
MALAVFLLVVHRETAQGSFFVLYFSSAFHTMSIWSTSSFFYIDFGICAVWDSGVGAGSERHHLSFVLLSLYTHPSHMKCSGWVQTVARSFSLTHTIFASGVYHIRLHRAIASIVFWWRWRSEECRYISE